MGQNSSAFPMEAVEGFTAEEVASKADGYFDKEGRLLENSIGQVHHVADKASKQPPATRQPAPPPTHNYTAPFEEGEDEGVHAVAKGKPAPKRPQLQQNRPTTNNRGSSNGPSSSNWRNCPAPDAASAPPGPGTRERLCMYHRRWKDNAQQCETKCSRFDQFMAAKNQQGNARGSRWQ